MTASETAARNRSRASLLLVIALFAAPVVLAWVLFFIFPDWIPTSTSNHGELVKPLRPMPDFSLERVSGGPVDNSFLQGKWTFVYPHRGACGEPCIQQLYKMRQVRLTQGKNIGRLRRLMLWRADAVSPSARAELQQHFPGLAIALVPHGGWQKIDVFTDYESAAPGDSGIYLLDPLGNVMMRYIPDQAPRGIIKDLERLLKYSGLG